ncbi:MAG: CBS domain-containing protein [Nitrospirae bacterium]|nr:CBS domain-containing protein [Nitrospirota bacterium]
MNDRSISAVVVVDEHNKMVGLFTERDVVRCFAANVPFDAEILNNVISKNMITFDPSTEISAAISVVASKKIRHIPVLEGDKIVGMITYRDLVSYVLPEIIYMAEDIY